MLNVLNIIKIPTIGGPSHISAMLVICNSLLWELNYLSIGDIFFFRFLWTANTLLKIRLKLIENQPTWRKNVDINVKQSILMGKRKYPPCLISIIITWSNVSKYFHTFIKYSISPFQNWPCFLSMSKIKIVSIIWI